MVTDAKLAFGQDGWKPGEVRDESRPCVDPTGSGWADLVADNIASNRSYRWNNGIGRAEAAMAESYCSQLRCTYREARAAIAAALERLAAASTAAASA